MKYEDLSEIIRSRRSIRRWQDKEVPEVLLIQAIELATWAPNGGNWQCWHFYIITNRKTIKAIAKAVWDRMDQIASWPEAEVFGNAAIEWRDTESFIKDAPAVVAIAVETGSPSATDQILATRERIDPEAAMMRQWRIMANTRIQSVASAIAYLSLVLHQIGLGAVWMNAPVIAKGDIEKILDIPQGMNLIAFMPVGYPDESPVSKGRRPIDEVTEIIR
jgi:nitroreductase